MNKKTLTITLALVLFGCFFLPYMDSGVFAVSGYDTVFKFSNGSWEKYLWLLIPVSAVMLLLGAAGGNYFLGRNTLVWIPLLTVLFIILRFKMETNVTIAQLLESIGYGLWISLAASLLMVFYNPKS